MTIRLARLALALAPLSLGVAASLAPPPVFAAPVSSASDGLPPGAPPLTPTQRQQQQARIQSFLLTRNALVSNPRLTPAQKQQQFLALQSKFQQDMLSILTPAQRAAVNQQNAKIVGLRQLFAKQHAGEIAQLQQMNTRLAALNASTTRALTPAQRQKVAAIQDQARAQLQRLQAENSPPQVKQQTAQAIIRDAQRQAFAVLTPAEQAPLRQLQAQIVSLQTRLGQELTAFAKAHGQS